MRIFSSEGTLYLLISVRMSVSFRGNRDFSAANKDKGLFFVRRFLLHMSIYSVNILSVRSQRQKCTKYGNAIFSAVMFFIHLLKTRMTTRIKAKLKISKGQKNVYKHIFYSKVFKSLTKNSYIASL